MKLSETARLFDSLSDPTRLRILALLAEGELCVCDLMCVLREPQSKVSRHLSYLRRTGLVAARRKGLWMYYRLLAPAGTGWLKSVGAHLKSLPEVRKDRLALKASAKKLVACCPC